MSLGQLQNCQKLKSHSVKVDNSLCIYTLQVILVTTATFQRHVVQIFQQRQ